jgi:4'-phosphopantetheinyl transferase
VPPSVPAALDGVDVWLLRLDDTAAGLARAHGLTLPAGSSAAAWLDADERARAARLHDATDRHRWLLSHVATRLLVGLALDRHPADVTWRREPCRRCGGPHGRPVVVDGDDLHVSLSRSGDTALLALRRGLPVGVDVEQVTTGPAATPPDDLHRWVRAEAVLKSTGDGLTRDPAAVDVGDPSRARWSGEVEGLDLALAAAAGTAPGTGADPRLLAALAGPALHGSSLRVHLPVTAST